jgi:hypothetical protein
MGEKKGWFGRNGEEKAKQQKMFGGYATRQQQLEAIELGLQPSQLRKEKEHGKSQR